MMMMMIRAIVAAAATEIDRTVRVTAMTDHPLVVLIETIVTAHTRKGIVVININKEID